MSNLPHETALKLKEHGFPQETESVIVRDKQNGSEIRTTPSSVHPDWGLLSSERYPNLYEPALACPTLEEIIAECGEDFCGLIKRTDWLAVGKPKGIHQTGPTPLLAAANLYCELNKKQ